MSLQADLPELVRFLLGAGCRIGEALTLTWPNVDLERHLINIDSTLIRVTGQGLLIKHPKTKSSIRVLRVAALARGDFCVIVGPRNPESQSARTVADQLGHARISMTQGVYVGRRAVDPAAAAVLDGISPPGYDGDEMPPAVLSVVV